MPEPSPNDEIYQFLKKSIFQKNENFEIFKCDFKSIPGVPGAIFNPPWQLFMSFWVLISPSLIIFHSMLVVERSVGKVAHRHRLRFQT